MKKIWIVLKVVGVCICLFLFISSVKGKKMAVFEVNKVQAEVNQAWNNLERAAPLLAKEYDHALKKQQEVVAAYSFHDVWAIFVTVPLALLLTSLLWQFVIVPIRTRWRARQPYSLKIG